MIPGVRVGHWTDEVAATGCTVVLLPPGTVASGEVRGGAPGTREFDLLSPERLVSRVDAVVLSGGSAFGLAACDGVVRWCEERGIGLPTAGGVVPIVVGMVLYDLAVGDGSVRPDAASGYDACAGASEGPVVTGRVGAGTGATVGKWRGRELARPGGLGWAARSDGELVVAAVVAVNALGDVGGAGDVVPHHTIGAFENTTIGVVVTNASLAKTGCLLVAQGAHDGLARAVQPAHTSVDGDAFVAAATGELDGEVAVDTVRALATAAVEHAIRAAVPSE